MHSIFDVNGHLNSPPKLGGRRGALASVATTEALASQRSAEGLYPRRGGGGKNGNKY